jgi:hypothetical protein
MVWVEDAYFNKFGYFDCLNLYNLYGLSLLDLHFERTNELDFLHNFVNLILITLLNYFI